MVRNDFRLYYKLEDMESSFHNLLGKGHWKSNVINAFIVKGFYHQWIFITKMAIDQTTENQIVRRYVQIAAKMLYL
jgi:pyrroloquinoline quinone (PQQ) biosynthesis protein C